MNFKGFRLNIVIRILLITASIFLFHYSFSVNYVFTPIISGTVTVFLVVSFIRYVDRVNRELTNLLESIRFSEFNRTFSFEGMKGSFKGLNEAFNDVISDFQKVRAEKEEHFYYLQTILQNIDVSVIAFREDGTIELINKAAKKLFQVSGLRNIQGLESLSPELVKVLFGIKPGQNELVRVQDDDDFLQLTIYATNFRIKDKVITLVTVKDIQMELEEKETEAWQKLIRVLTHEIMNSITPISSLTSTLTMSTEKMEKDKKGNVIIDKESVEELSYALKTINKRSNGLIHFVNTYRNLTKIPQPDFKICKVSDLIHNITHIMKEEASALNVSLEVNIEPENMTLTADEQLIEQVLINLVKNSLQALKGGENRKIKLLGFFNKRGRATIQIIDNGPGILPEVLERIFIPFFTTKQTGSGIGLALSRQILRLHNGSITAQSAPDKETVFTLTF